jgi:polyphosphate kinase 2 (PPK2 family)
MFMQRYVEKFPAGGEIVIFDRSWYNRAGVEYVMGFCTPEQRERFLELCAEIEKYIVDGGIRLIKFWLEVGQDEQERRFLARMNDPLRQWQTQSHGPRVTKRHYAEGIAERGENRGPGKDFWKSLTSGPELENSLGQTRTKPLI